jgi:hypothetical protein
MALSELRSGHHVFAVPGVHVLVPSRRGDVRLTPLFLHREQLDDALSAAQDLVAQHVRLSDVLAPASQ